MTVRRVRIEESGMSQGRQMPLGASRGRSSMQRICDHCHEPVIYAQKDDEGRWECDSCEAMRRSNERSRSMNQGQHDRDLKEVMKNDVGDLRW